MHFSNIEHIPDDFLNVLTQISSKKYLIKITLVFSDNFKLDTIVLFNTGANLNCIKKQFLQTTSGKLFAANNSKLHIAGKTQASVFNKGISLLKHSLSLQKILIIPSFSGPHSST
jgi:hypothetical protein